MIQRLDKILASQSTMSRSETVRLIRAGRVLLNGTVCRDASTKADAEKDEIVVDGKPFIYRQYVYLMLNKPAGILCVSRDPRVKTVVDLLPPSQQRKGLFPAGRLDKDTVGLVLLTDDGDYAHRMLSPKSGVPKRYQVRVDGLLDEADVKAFADGITLADGTVCRPAILTIIESTERESLAEVCITEGKYHQIKRMFGTRDRGVVWLKRVSIGQLVLDDTLSEGESRFLSDEERQKAFCL